jgi:uncharacterized protein
MPSTTESQQIIDALRSAYAAFNRGDLDSAVAPMDEHIEWIEPNEFPGGGTYYGHEGVKRYLKQSRDAWAEVDSQPVQFLPAGNKIVVFVHARVRAKESTDWNEVELADVYTIKNGKAIQMRAFAERHEALRWSGAKLPTP